jgi:thiol-disulfide isomerase/thioredoxin
MASGARPSGRARLIGGALVGAGVVLVALLLGTLTGADRDDASGQRAASPPLLRDRIASTEQAPLPEAILDGFAGGPPVRLAGYRGRPLVVNFWATWCTPCVEELPVFQRVADRLGERVAVLGVDVQDSPRNAEPFVRDLGVRYDLAVDPAATLYRQVRAYGMPTTLFVDPEGTIVYRHTGALDEAGLVDLLERQLGVEVPA